MKNKPTLGKFILLFVATLALATMGFAQTQTVTPAPTPQTVAASAAFGFDVNYSSTSATTTGLGIQMCWDSTKVTFVSLTSVLATSKIAQDATGSADAGNIDGDATTNTCLGVAWADAGGAWPGTTTATLFHANFTAGAGFNSGSTHLNFPATDNAVGFTYSFTPETVNAVVPVAVASVSNATMQAGANANMTVTLNQNAPAGGTTVNLSSGTPAVATLPSATVLVPAGANSAPFVVHGVSVGTSTISAQVGATPAQTGTATVTAATITLNCPTNVSNGGTAPCTVQVTPGQATTVTLATAGGHTTVPPSVVTNASGAGTFNVTGTSIGGPDTITATLPVGLGGAFATDTVTVQAVTLTVSPTTVASGTVGAPISFTVCISAPQGAASPITFTGANVANFVFSPASPSIPAGQICPTTVSFTATPVAVTGAPQTFTVNAGGLSVPVNVSAVAGITCTLTDAGNGALLTISQAQPVGFPVTVTSSNTAVLTVSSPFNFPAGQTSALIPYTVLTAGTSDIVTTLDVTVGGGVCRTVATVNPTPIPAVGGLGLALLAGLLALAGAFFVRKH